MLNLNVKMYLNLSFMFCRLSNCSITEEGYKALASALKSNSHLIELDLTGNDPGESGVEQLIDLQKGRWFSSKTLKTLR